MNQTKNLTYLALFMAIEIILISVPFLGFIPIGPLRATTLHIPVIIAGITLGRKEGCFVGFIFGLFSLINNTINPTVTSFVFSPFISGHLISAFIAIIPRILIGFVSASVFQWIKPFHQNIALFVSSFLGALTNTCLVLGGIYFLFGHDYALAIGQSSHTLLAYFISIITTQSLLEALLGSIIVLAVCKVLLVVKRG